MKNFIFAFLAFTCMSIGLAKATNYTGTLVVTSENGTELANQESAVEVTQNGTAVSLEINSFSFAGIPLPMNITLDCQCVGGVLQTPATLTVTPAWIVSSILGNLELRAITGTLDGSKCTLNMTVYASKRNETINITFN